jgi:nucleoside-diphosphate-sugar epimerase
VSEKTAVLVTGANGFVGSALMKELQKRGHRPCVGAIREVAESEIFASRYVGVGHIGGQTDWSPALGNVDTVVHTAAITHGGGQVSDEQKKILTDVNVDGSLALARQAAASGVRRFIFLSSVKVHGEASLPGRPFSVSDSVNPADAYAVSKWRAEQGLKAIAEGAGMEFVVIRPPLIYGHGVKGNFASLIKIVGKGIPVPFGAIENRRSLVSLQNLVDLIVRCIDHSGAVNRTFLVSDNQDVSTPELLRKLGEAIGTQPRLVAISPKLLLWGLKLLGKRDAGQRLLSSLQVDISDTRSLLGWEPRVSLQQGLKDCVQT